MRLVGGDYLAAALASEGYFVKFIVHEQMAHFFAYTTEHRDATLPGLCYRDDSQGNALAGTLKPQRIDIRHHQAFSEERVKHVWDQLLAASGTDEPGTPAEPGKPVAELLKEFPVYYGGKLVTSNG